MTVSELPSRLKQQKISKTQTPLPTLEAFFQKTNQQIGRFYQCNVKAM